MAVILNYFYVNQTFWGQLLRLKSSNPIPFRANVTDEESCASEIFYLMLLHLDFLSSENGDLRHIFIVGLL